MATSREKIRNVAVIAHIDHGKTTLLDEMLKQAEIFAPHEKVPVRVMDSYDQEKERGITIFSKNTSLFYEDFKVNVIDTPGHSDFSGEVERVLGMVNSVLLVIDAQEGPMPQTRFVLSKALQMGLKPIVVINKIDRPHATPDKALDLTFDLFVELGANDEQLDFAHCYASALAGYAMRHITDPRENMRPLFELIIEKVDAPDGELDQPFLMQVLTLAYDDFTGRQARGRILQGKIRQGDEVIQVDAKGKERKMRITKVQGNHGLKQVELDEATVGDIATLAGIEDVMIGDTLCSPQKVVHLPPIKIEPPTVSIGLSVNSSPLCGREGTHVTMQKIRDRLEKEKRANITYGIDTSPQEHVTVAGRGELHLSILIEAMRREGYEITVSKPQVITKEIDGKKCEPIERIYVQVPEANSGAVIEELSRRKGEMTQLSTNEFGVTSLEFLIPTRGLMGYRNDFLTMTRGEGILTSVFERFDPWKGEIPGRSRGVLVSMCDGKSTGYALSNLEPRGTLFLEPGIDVYEGMIVGQHNRENDLIVNAVRGKKLTNVRASGTDQNVMLAPPRRFSLEQAIDYIEDDEYIEVTPATIRLRKKYLTENERKRHDR